MAKFQYSALTLKNETKEGKIKAKTLSSAKAKLRSKDLTPISVHEALGVGQIELTKEKAKKKHLLVFTSQMAVFVRAGMSMTSALETIAEETPDNVLRRALLTMATDIRDGISLSDAAAKHPEAFPGYYLGVLKSAELTGRLDKTLDSLADYLDRELEMKSKIVSSLSYPMVVAVMAMGTVAILAGFVLPKFKPLFEELDADLPLPTRMMLFVATLFTDLVYIPAGLFAAFVGTMIWLFKTESGKKRRDKLVLKIPAVKGIVSYSMLERFCRILATMTHAGVPLPAAVSSSIEATSNHTYQEKLRIAEAELLAGGGFAAPIAATELFPGAVTQMIKVGEEAGSLGDQLIASSEYLDRELDYRIKKFTALFEPIMIIFVGAIVGFVAIALVSAMYGVLGDVQSET